MDDQNKQPCVGCKMCRWVSRYWWILLIVVAALIVAMLLYPVQANSAGAAPEVSQDSLELYEKLLVDKEANLDRWLAFIAGIFTLLAIIPAFLVYLANQAKTEAVEKATEVRKEAEEIARELKEMRKQGGFQFLAQQAGILVSQKDYTGAIRLWSELVSDPEVPSDWRPLTFFNRGVAYGAIGDRQREIEDYTRVLKSPDADPELRAIARVNRGIAYFHIKKFQSAITDLTRVIDMPDAPAIQRAKALFFLATIHADQKETAKCNATLERAKEMESVVPASLYRKDSAFDTVREVPLFKAFLKVLEA